MYPIDLFFRAAQRYPSRVALRGPDDEVVYFEELAEQVNALATAMQREDPSNRSRVAICAGNSAEHVVALLATLAAGKIWVPLNQRSTALETNRILQSVTPSIVLADKKGYELVSDSATVIMIGPPHKSKQTIGQLAEPFIGQSPETFDLNRDETQAIKFTGGTTGAPKGVMQPYRAWSACIVNQIHAWRLNEDDCYVVCAPISHGTSTYLLPILAQGGSLAFPSENNPPHIAKAFDRFQGTISFMPPTLVYMLMSDPQVKVEHFSSLRHLVVGGAPMPPEKVDEAIGFFGPKIALTYGQTEAPQIVTAIRPEDVSNPINRGSSGPVTWFSDLAIMSPEGHLVPHGEKGEVVVRGDLVMAGYWNMPEKTAETIVDGWLHTGDVGYLDERGYLFIKDRVRDIVITGGFNVYPVDVENALCKHPAVHEASVFGLPDPKWGEAVHAAVQVKSGQAVTDKELMQHVKTLLGGVHTPKKIHFFEQLPRSPVGKVLKKDIKDQLSISTVDL